MIRDQNRLIEAAQSYIGGANSSLDPAIIEDTQFSWGTNIRIRGGYPKTRPGFRFVGAIPGGKIQGATYFSSKYGEVLAFSISGRLYTVDPIASTFNCLDVTPVSGGNSASQPFVYMANANGFLIVQDSQSPAIIYSGSNSYRSVGVLESVPSTVKVVGSMAVNAFRITVESVSGLVPGMLVQAARGVQPETRIVSIDSSTTLTLNKATEVAAFAEFSFYTPGPLQQDVSIPVGGPTVYANGRLWVARGNELYAGDLVNSYKNAHLRFSEILYLSGGGAFSFDDKIVALSVMPGADTSTGQGDLIVFTKKSVNAIRSYVYDREQWQQTVGMQRFVYDGVGDVSHESIVGTANDLYFRAKDGVMSFKKTLKEKATSTVILSDSREADRIFFYDTSRWLYYADAVFFDNRYIVTGSPVVQRINPDYEDGYNIVHRSLVVNDLSPGSVRGEAFPPAYDGEWTGLQVSKLVSGSFKNEERCFAICCDTQGHNALYEITKNDLSDTNSSGNKIQITSGIELKRMDFQSPADVKELIRADIGFSEIFGPFVTPSESQESPSFSWTFSFRPDYYPTFFTIQSDTVQVDTGNTNPIPGKIPLNLRPAYLNVRTVKPSDSCVTVSNRLARFGYMFQPKLEWTGNAKLSLFRLHSNRKDVSDLGEC